MEVICLFEKYEKLLILRYISKKVHCYHGSCCFKCIVTVGDVVQKLLVM